MVNLGGLDRPPAGTRPPPAQSTAARRSSGEHRRRLRDGGGARRPRRPPRMLNQNGLKRPPGSTPAPWAHATPARRLDRRHGGRRRGARASDPQRVDDESSVRVVRSAPPAHAPPARPPATARQAHEHHRPNPQQRASPTDRTGDAAVAAVRGSAMPPVDAQPERPQATARKHTSPMGPRHARASARQTARGTWPWQRGVGPQRPPRLLHRHGLERSHAITPAQWTRAAPARQLDRRHGGRRGGGGASRQRHPPRMLRGRAPDRAPTAVGSAARIRRRQPSQGASCNCDNATSPAQATGRGGDAHRSRNCRLGVLPGPQWDKCQGHGLTGAVTHHRGGRVQWAACPNRGPGSSLLRVPTHQGG